MVVLATLLFSCGLAYEPLYHIARHSLAYSLIPQDDFYYYYITAKHFAATGLSSFDGIVPTNGYHPLWILILSFVSFVTHGNDTANFIVLELLQIAASVVTAALLLRLFRELYGKQPWIAPLLLLASLLLTVLIFLSMETVVAIPLYVLFALAFLRMLSEQASSMNAFLAGLAGAFLFFARSDTLLALGIAGALLFYYRAGMTKILAFSSGLLPVVAYFIFNKVVFGSWLSVSAQIKELTPLLHASFLPVEVIFTPRGGMYAVLTIIGFVFCLRGFRRMDSRSGIRLLLFAFPVLYAILLALRLSWPVYVWYFYPFPISAAAGLIEIRNSLGTTVTKVIDRLARVGGAVIIVLAGLVLSRDITGLTMHLNLDVFQTRAQPNVYAHALGIKPFTDSHPGRYAMGDRAGLTAFITGQPILQIEGLVADQPLVDSIRARADLLQVLRKYGVRYYIVSYPFREFHEAKDVWDLYEPHKQQALPWMPLMHGRFYAPEVFRFPFPVGAIVTESDSAQFVTRILDVSQAREATPGTN